MAEFEVDPNSLVGLAADTAGIHSQAYDGALGAHSEGRLMQGGAFGDVGHPSVEGALSDFSTASARSTDGVMMKLEGLARKLSSAASEYMGTEESNAQRLRGERVAGAAAPNGATAGGATAGTPAQGAAGATPRGATGSGPAGTPEQRAQLGRWAQRFARSARWSKAFGTDQGGNPAASRVRGPATGRGAAGPQETPIEPRGRSSTPGGPRAGRAAEGAGAGEPVRASMSRARRVGTGALLGLSLFGLTGKPVAETLGGEFSHVAQDMPVELAAEEQAGEREQELEARLRDLAGRGQLNPAGSGRPPKLGPEVSPSALPALGSGMQQKVLALMPDGTWRWKVPSPPGPGQWSAPDSGAAPSLGQVVEESRQRWLQKRGEGEQ